ncbi:MAG: hypothetical protein K9L24_04605 [Spirochaetia bacterium]|nr:hypothetical protein [Spirochaetia bacterium]
MEAALALLITINTDYNVQLRIILYLKLLLASYQIAGKKSMAEIEASEPTEILLEIHNNLLC